ncbi:MAG: cytochrome c [Pricia sp.]|nr:cytochrome c [Pricia sp.]
MKKQLLIAALAIVFIACGDEKKKEGDDNEGFKVTRSAEKDDTSTESVEVPVDMDNKGIGPITDLTFPEEIDEEMAARGEAKFNAICTACHMPNQRMIGPPMAGVYDRRSPEWVMNMMLNPDEMLQKDPIAIALLKEYNNAIMLNQNLTEEEARELAEYLRTL